MSREFMAIISGIGLLIVVGLLLTHSTASTSIENATFSGVSNLVRTLQLQNTSGTH